MQTYNYCIKQYITLLLITRFFKIYNKIMERHNKKVVLLSIKERVFKIALNWNLAHVKTNAEKI